MNKHNKRVIAFVTGVTLLTSPLLAMSPVFSPVTANSVSASADTSVSYDHNFTTNGTSSSFFSITGNLSTQKGTVNYNGQTLTQCLKMESSTSIGFNAPSSGKLTLVFVESGATIKLDGTKLTASNGIITADVSAGSHTLTKADAVNLFYMSLSTSGGSQTDPATPSDPATPTDPTTPSEPSTPSDTNIDGVKVISAGGWNEALYLEFSGLKDSDVTGVSYSGAASGKLTGDDLKYLVRDTSAGLRVDIPGVSEGTYSVTVTTGKGSITQSGLSVNAYDRSGYAHYNYSSGVGAYTDKGILKSNAIVLYVTNDNKDTVSVTSKDGTTVKGIGNILNSVGQDVGGGKTSNVLLEEVLRQQLHKLNSIRVGSHSEARFSEQNIENGIAAMRNVPMEDGHISGNEAVYNMLTLGSSKANTNQGIIKKLAQDGTPLVIRFIGDVKAPSGLTAYDSIDYGGSVGDNGFMARMKSGKDVTLEGIGTDATVDGWGFHFMCESSAPTLGKSLRRYGGRSGRFDYHSFC